MTSHQAQEVTVEQIEEVFPIADPLENPPKTVSTTLTQQAFSQLYVQFGIDETEALLPGVNDTADRPPLGFIAVNRQMCLSGAIPPFNDFLRKLLLRLTISLFQLHPNGYAILMGLCVLFERTLNRLPSFDEICYLCSFERNKDHPSITLIRSARNRKLITDLPDSAHGFLNQFFFVRCPSEFYGIWRVGTFSSLSKDSSHKSTFERLNVVAVEERSIKFLLKDEFLHQFGLLHPSRSLQLRDAPAPQPETSDAPAPAKELALKELVAEASLIKCSGSAEGAEFFGKSKLLPVIEEEELQQCPGKTATEADEGTEKESSATKSVEHAEEGTAGVTHSAGHDGDDIFGGLSDFMVTSQELFKDDITATKLVSPSVEATSVSCVE